MTPEEVGARLVQLLGGQAGPSIAVGHANTTADTATGGPAVTGGPAAAGGDATVDGPAPPTGTAPPAGAGAATDAAPATGTATGTAFVAAVSGGGAWAHATVDVPSARWRDALRTVRDDAELRCDFFDWLSAVDALADGFEIVAHVWSTTHRHGVLVRTRVGRAEPTVASVVDIYPGAAWHERETHEMFGVDFPGHPGGLRPLLLPPEFEGYPLRKEFVLATRVAKPWPGAKEPGESHDASASRRQPMRPPGVPDPFEWGPRAGQRPEAAAATESRPRRSAPARPARTAGPPRTTGANRAGTPAAQPSAAQAPDAEPPDAGSTGEA